MAFPRSFRRKLVLIFGILPFLYSCYENHNIEDKTEYAENANIITGKSLFLQHCAICHGEDGALGASGAKDLTRSSLDSIQVVAIINNGKNAMPPMKELLETHDNVGKVVAHVLKLRK
jgi:mono/diheme cytochrome c family protein